jgi:diguanylate cyclase (GGDEF)-like protein
MTGAVPTLERDPADAGAAAGPAAPELAPISASVLMIDDEPLMIAAVGAFLEDAGYRNFSGETDPSVGLARLAAEQPDVLLLDLIMPGVSGFDVLARVRADPQLQRTPVIVMTSASDSGTKLRVLELGATDFLEKPVDPSELVLRLRNTLAFKAYRDRSTWFDMTTGLPNRRLMASQLARALRRTGGDERCALLQVEIGRLRQLAEALGQRSVDDAVRTIAQRLQGAVRAGDALGRVGDERAPGVVSRLGSDEFGVLLTGLRRPQDALAVARRVLAAVAAPLDAGGRPWTPAVAIGVATAPDDALDAEGLLRSARAAVGSVRERGGVGFYSADMSAAALERLTLEAQLRAAIGGDELVLHYQPKVDAVSHRTVGAEALVRWRHPERGLLSPAAFVPLAEETGLIADLGAWVLREACRSGRRWLDAGTPCRVAVNVAAPQLVDGRLLGELRAALADTGLPPALLTVELTESMLTAPGADGFAVLAELEALGVAIALDDFGTGWSSLAYLKRMPIDELKIDRSFVAGLPHDGGDAAIVRAIVSLATSLRMTAVAEGVETAEQAAFLAGEGCGVLQGWLFARAMPEDAFLRHLAATSGADGAPAPAAAVPAG